MNKMKSMNKESDRKYYLARVRVEGHRAKFQIHTTRLNRDYGVTFEVDTTKLPYVRYAISKKQWHGATVPSLYDGSKELYVLCQIRLPHGSNKIRVQMRTKHPVNRKYGIAFDVYQIGLHASLKAHIETYDPVDMKWSTNSQDWVKKSD